MRFLLLGRIDASIILHSLCENVPVSACALLKAWDEFQNGEVLKLKLYEHLKV